MAEDTFTIPSFAKINWFLRILGRREDGFHELCTAFQTVSLRDELTFSKHDELYLTCGDETIPTDENNLIIKAANELRKRFDIKRGAAIHLEKRIPSPGGLGGGSSNAAAALFGLIKIWQIKIEFAELLQIGAHLGSDVPFFFYGGTALGTGRGTEIQPLANIAENFLLIVAPPISVSTAEAFGRLSMADLTNKSSKSILQICRYEAEGLNLRQSLLSNDFENSVFDIAPEIRKVKFKLIELKAEIALLSGSGASVFGVFRSRFDLQNAVESLKIKDDWRVFEVQTVSRREYRELLNLDTSLFPKDF